MGEEQKTRKRYEYMHKNESDWRGSDHDELDSFFNELGSDGWELCAAEVHEDGRIWYFKREI